MEIRINKDIREYEQSVFLGMTLRQIGFALGGIIAAVAVFYLTYKHIGVSGGALVAGIAALPFVAFGFYQKEGKKMETLTSSVTTTKPSSRPATTASTLKPSSSQATPATISPWTGFTTGSNPRPNNQTEYQDPDEWNSIPTRQGFPFPHSHLIVDIRLPVFFSTIKSNTFG